MIKEGSSNDEKRQTGCKIEKKTISRIFQENYRKGWEIMKKCQILKKKARMSHWAMIFSAKYGKISKRWKMMKKGRIIKKKAKMDVKTRKWFVFFRKFWKMSNRVGNDATKVK
jgi:hypothetical protein